MDYEKAYKDALERARKINSGEGVAAPSDWTTCEVIFPELKESEDERIRKELIDAIHGLWDNDALPMPLSAKRKDNWLAWLEKQGEKSPFNKERLMKVAKPETFEEQIEHWQRMRGIAEEMVKELLKKQAPKNKTALDKAIEDEVNAWLEKQGKQEQTSEFNAVDWQPSKVDGKIHNIYNSGVEQKFHEGDWIVNNDSGSVCQIKKIKDDEYCLWPLDAEILGYLRIIDVDNDYHLWTIEDAKDGDVLIYQDEIFLFNLVDNGYVHFHCCYDGELITHNLYDFSYKELSDVQPATKEQRDILFQKMKEAGYEWNAEKKELCKYI